MDPMIVSFDGLTLTHQPSDDKPMASAHPSHPFNRYCPRLENGPRYRTYHYQVIEPLRLIRMDRDMWPEDLEALLVQLGVTIQSDIEFSWTYDPYMKIWKAAIDHFDVDGVGFFIEDEEMPKQIVLRESSNRKLKPAFAPLPYEDEPPYVIFDGPTLTHQKWQNELLPGTHPTNPMNWYCPELYYGSQYLTYHYNVVEPLRLIFIDEFRPEDLERLLLEKFSSIPSRKDITWSQDGHINIWYAASKYYAVDGVGVYRKDGSVEELILLESANRKLTLSSITEPQ